LGGIHTQGEEHMTPVFVITFGDVLGLIALAIFLLVVGCFYIKQAWKKRREAKLKEKNNE
jgi:predicted membrane protein